VLKNINLPIFIGLITSISAISIQPAAYASTTFCNQTAFPVEVAYARGTFDPRPSIQSTNYKIKGWLPIDPSACTIASTEPADKIDLPNGYTLVRHYYYVRFASINLTLTKEISPQAEKFCIKDTNFQYSTEIGDALSKSKCDRGYKQVKFSTFNSDIPNHTVLLTSPQNSSPQSKIKSFAEWCESKNTVSITTKRTIDILLKKSATSNCKLADEKLSNLTELELIGNKIVDLQPLASLKKLTTLFLEDNQIVDVSPLANLTNLTSLRLGINKIVDVKPLAVLTKLKNLSLHNNQIRDIKSLSKLTKMFVLQVSDNPIDKKICPLKPKSTCVWVYE
jgi:Protein of unknown function (DUF1036)/Leucine Rich repeats (2 copies)